MRDSNLHTLAGWLWIGAILILTLKTEILDHLVAGTEAFTAAVMKLLAASQVF